MKYLDVRSINSGYNANIVLKNVSFSADRGEFIGIIGPNGAGKSTLLKNLTAVIKPYQGSVFVTGVDLHSQAPFEIAKKVALVSQNLISIFSFTVEEIVSMGRTPYIGVFGNESKADNRVVYEVLELLNLSRLKSKPLDELSAGERQLVMIAKSLAQQSEILLLDEPTSHLDIGNQITILDHVRRLQTEKNLTVIAVFHDLNLASQYSDRILLLDKGIVAASGTPQNVLRPELLEKYFNARLSSDTKILKDKPLLFPLSRLNKY